MSKASIVDSAKEDALVTSYSQNDAVMTKKVVQNPKIRLELMKLVDEPFVSIDERDPKLYQEFTKLYRKIKE
jgi:hypothetical protein